MGTSAQADFKGVIARHKSPSVYRSSAGWFTVTAYSEIPSPGGIVIPVSVSRTTAQMIFCGPPAVNDALHERSSLIDLRHSHVEFTDLRSFIL
jgi:hypothetical protein